MEADLFIHNADRLYTCQGPAPRRGAAQQDAGLIEHAAIAASRGVIVAVGPTARVRTDVHLTADATVLDASGGTVVPGFVDPHTHLVYAGDRRDELQRRLAGASYAEIAAEGGGIVSTVRATRGASEEELVASALPRLAAMLRCGTTTVEIKSGYGLDTASELRMLRAIRTLGTRQPIEIAATFMGAHEIPIEYRSRRDDYVRLVVDEMIPAVAAEQLAEWCDVFCEQGVFTPEETRIVLEAGLRHGLAPRVHADELASSGGSALAAQMGARSADHLIYVDAPHARLLAERGVVATLLPAAAFFLKLGRFAPARMLIDAAVPVALATDMNPGGGFSPSMPFVMTLAAFEMHMTLEEALVGATLNAAASLDRADRIGSLEVGKQLDAVVIDGTLADLIRIGTPVIRAVIKDGKAMSAH
ncbi:MAG TPA: imidazolonepropionase [Vicinamibacterales bacterium]|nr:imidazolonepropionase [Vicinamibacterales bacterium]